MFKKHKFISRGIGIISSKFIPHNSFIGNYFTKFEPITFDSRLIYNGWVETNPLGRYLNHSNKPNCNLILNTDVIEIYTNIDINSLKELTINYLDVIKLIDLPEELIQKYSIYDYEYIDEEIIIKSNLI